MEEKGNYLFKFYVNHKRMEPFVGDRLYGVTREYAETISIGIVMGMRCKYRHPIVEVYEVKDNGEELLIREQR